MIHFTGKDRNRNQVESLRYELDRCEIRNLLVMTGDYPQYGFQGNAKPVFDLDSVHILHMIKRMNEGRELDGRAPGGGVRLDPTRFFPGCVVSPFKRFEDEVVPQYYKLSKKIREGARFIITQLGFDPLKFREALLYVREKCPGVPLLGNIYLLTPKIARVMNRGAIPGCVVSDRLLHACLEEAEHGDGHEKRLWRGAKLLAVLRGLGYDGAHLGGPDLTYEDIRWIVEKSTQLSSRWQEIWKEIDFSEKGIFYLYPSGTRDPIDRYSHLPGRSAGYRLMRKLHHLMFSSETPLFAPAQWVCRRIQGTFGEKLLGGVEHWIKFLTSRCRQCGDCTLLEVAFLCPQSQCPKFLFNGACGGTTSEMKDRA